MDASYLTLDNNNYIAKSKCICSQNGTYLKWSLSSQALKHNGPYTPQVSLGIIVL